MNAVWPSAGGVAGCRTEPPRSRRWIGVARGKFFAWRKRYGKANEHNALVPRDHWLTEKEKQKIIAFHDRLRPAQGDDQGDRGDPAVSRISRAGGRLHGCAPTARFAARGAESASSPAPGRGWGGAIAA